MSKTLLIILGLAVAVGLAVWVLLSGPEPEPVPVNGTAPVAAVVPSTPAAPAVAETQPVATAPVEAAPVQPAPAESEAAPEAETAVATPPTEPEIVAEVNGVEIEQAALEKGAQAILSQYASLYRQMGQDFQTMLVGAQGYVLTLGVEAQALDRLVFKAIADAEVKARGLVVTDDALEAEFNKQYEQFLTSQGMTEESLANLLTAQGVTLDAFKESGRANIREQLLMLQLQTLVAGPVEVSDTEVQTYWEANRDNYKTPEQIRASHILVKTEDEAKAILADLEGGADFATIAREKSTDTASGAQGGDLGWFERGKMVAQFEDAAFSLEVGQRSGIVQTQFGYHIILLTGKKPAVEPELADVRDQVEADAKQEIVTERANAWYTQVMADADVVVYNPMLAAARQQRENVDSGLAAFEALREAGSKDTPYLPYIIGTLYESQIQTLTRTKTQLEGAETPDEARIAELEAQIQDARGRAIAAYRETLQLVGTDTTIEERLQLLQSPSEIPQAKPI